MKKSFAVLSLVATFALVGVPTVLAASSSQHVKPQSQHLQPGQAGYVGALNDRPSNATAPSTKSISPMYVPYWYESEPSTINVLVRPNNDPSASGTVVTYNFGYYIDNVLPNEWEGGWPAEALKAGAVSVRSYGWYHTNYPSYANLGADVDNTINSQVFKPGSELASTDNAIQQTVDQALMSSGDTEEAGFYKAGTYGPGRDSSSYNFNNNAYQNGEDYYASVDGYSYTWMLSYYYPGTSIITGSGSSY